MRGQRVRKSPKLRRTIRLDARTASSRRSGVRKLQKELPQKSNAGFSAGRAAAEVRPEQTDTRGGEVGVGAASVGSHAGPFAIE